MDILGNFCVGHESVKIIKVLKAESVVSENAENHRIYINLQHRSDKNKIICM